MFITYYDSRAIFEIHRDQSAVAVNEDYVLKSEIIKSFIFVFSSCSISGEYLILSCALSLQPMLFSLQIASASLRDWAFIVSLFHLLCCILCGFCLITKKCVTKLWHNLTTSKCSASSNAPACLFAASFFSHCAISSSVTSSLATLLSS